MSANLICPSLPKQVCWGQHLPCGWEENPLLYHSVIKGVSVIRFSVKKLSWIMLNHFRYPTRRGVAKVGRLCRLANERVVHNSTYLVVVRYSLLWCKSTNHLYPTDRGCQKMAETHKTESGCVGVGLPTIKPKVWYHLVLDTKTDNQVIKPFWCYRYKALPRVSLLRVINSKGFWFKLF